MSTSLVTVAYIAAIMLFIMSLGGLSNPETSRRGNLYGMIGMGLAVLATIFGPRVTAAGCRWCHWFVCRAHGANDSNARAGGTHAQLGGLSRMRSRIRELH
jgi:NAD/NADP transhydrogenase beta subunit